jgi:hypothetical protein
MITIFISIGVMIMFATLLSLGLLIKGQELKGTCASRNVLLNGEGAVCGLCGKIPDGNCDNDTKTNQNLGDMPKIKK